MKFGIAVWPAAAAEWIELTISAIPKVAVATINTGAYDRSKPLDALLVDGDAPGPQFLQFYRDLIKQQGEVAMFVLGTANSPVMMAIDWSEDKTFFIAKPYQLEGLKDAIATKLESLEKSKAEEPQPAEAKPVEVKTPAASGGREGQNLGYLSTLRLSDLLQMLCLNGWTGKIVAQNLNSRETGEVYLNVGVLIHAVSGDAEAEAACHKMLLWGRCEFKFLENHPPVVQTIKAHWQEVILEGARLIDESGPDRAKTA